MADGITIDVKRFTNTQAITLLKNKLGQLVDDVLNKGADDIATMAIAKAPVDMGLLHNAATISAKKELFLEKHIVANVFYAPFMEFGTGQYAAEYVATLPATWQEYAATFKGKTGPGTFDDMVRNIFEWLVRNNYRLEPQQKQQGDTFRRGKLVKDKKPKKMTIEEGQRVLAYLTARRIMRDGNKPRPFMFPAYDYLRPKIIENVERELKGL